MNLIRISYLAFISLITSYTPILAQQALTRDSVKTAVPPSKTEWYKKINLRGYAQLRYNRLFETNPNLKCDQCDRSWGDNGGFFFRRIRLIFFGQVHERVYFYIQPDLASSPDGKANHFAQIRDAYFDVGLDKENEFRVRIGQSKVPYGFENMQSSQNRIPLDRNDALNSAVPNERDIGMFFYWAPKEIRKRFSELVASGLKGSGDYGVIGVGVFNGQTANRNENNNSQHVVARITYPFLIKGKQIIEPGVQAYSGRFVLPSISPTVTAINEQLEYLDERIAGTFVLYPQPFGIQTEFTVGTGPEYNPQTNRIDQKKLQGGYFQASYLLQLNGQTLIPFTRYQYYEGGKKMELDARSYSVRELEIGAEWQPVKNFEVVAMYTISQRRFEDSKSPVNFQHGNLLRLQFQLNF
jgi:hypothetical protein